MGYEQAVEKTKEALASEGFGVLSEINVRDTIGALPHEVKARLQKGLTKIQSP